MGRLDKTTCLILSHLGVSNNMDLRNACKEDNVGLLTSMVEKALIRYKAKFAHEKLVAQVETGWNCKIDETFKVPLHFTLMMAHIGNKLQSANILELEFASDNIFHSLETNYDF